MKFQNRGQAWASGMVFGIGLCMLLGAALAAWWSRGLPDK